MASEVRTLIESKIRIFTITVNVVDVKLAKPSLHFFRFDRRSHYKIAFTIIPPSAIGGMFMDLTDVCAHKNNSAVAKNNAHYQVDGSLSPPRDNPGVLGLLWIVVVLLNVELILREVLT